MPQPHRNAPDDEDVYNVCDSLAQEYSLLVEFTVAYKADFVESIARAYQVGGVVDKVVVYQALHRRRYRPSKSQAEVNFTLAYDIFMQASGGGATAAHRGPTYQWSGRPEIPRRRRMQ